MTVRWAVSQGGNRKLTLHNRERFYLATLRASPQCPIRRLTTPSLARAPCCPCTNLLCKTVRVNKPARIRSASILAAAVLSRGWLSHSAPTSAMPILALAVVGALTLAAYLPFLSTGFAATDSLPLVETSRLTDLGSAARLFTTPVMGGTAFALGEVVYRPFVSLTFGLDYLFWGPDPVGYHVSNLALHVVGVGAVWLLLARLGLSRWSSTFGAAIFALHPVVLATVPVIGRRDSIVPVVAFAASAALVLVAEDSRTRWRRRALLAVALLLAVAALLSKESAFLAVALLPMLLASRAFARGAGWSGALRSARLAVPFLLVAAGLFALRLKVLGGLGGTGDADIGFVDFYRYGVLIGAYLRNLLWAFADRAPATREIWIRLAGLIVLALALSIVWLPRRQAVLAATGALWIIAFGMFCAVLKVATLGWLAYFSLI